MKITLFGKNISPACVYCLYSRLNNPDEREYICTRTKNNTAVKEYDSCKKFMYEPTKRIPRPRPILPTYNAEDFSL